MDSLSGFFLSINIVQTLLTVGHILVTPQNTSKTIATTFLLPDFINELFSPTVFYVSTFFYAVESIIITVQGGLFGNYN